MTDITTIFASLTEKDIVRLERILSRARVRFTNMLDDPKHSEGNYIENLTQDLDLLARLQPQVTELVYPPTKPEPEPADDDLNISEYFSACNEVIATYEDGAEQVVMICASDEQAEKHAEKLNQKLARQRTRILGS